MANPHASRLAFLFGLGVGVISGSIAVVTTGFGLSTFEYGGAISGRRDDRYSAPARSVTLLVGS